jgi:MerR family transcriptional regulator, light-induced transcriptional regulator
MDTALVSIGEVAEATGLSPEVIRVWERRYGFPVPVRLPSGHRRYRAEDLRRLRWLSLALARGKRPSQVVPMPLPSLRTLLDTTESAPVAEILEAVRALDGEEIRRRLHEAWQRHGLMPFLCEVVGPLLERVGTLWVDDVLQIEHEHLLTELLEDLLRALRTGFQPKPEVPVVALATLPGERHRLGLLMAALAYAAKGARVEVLGTDLPLATLAAAVRGMGAATLGISVSLAGGGEGARRLLQDLRERIPKGVRLVVGGQGAARMRRLDGIYLTRGLELV